MKRYLFGLNINDDFNRDRSQEFISQFIPENENAKLNDKLFIDLLENRLIGEDGTLTSRGYSVIRNIVRETKITTTLFKQF